MTVRSRPRSEATKVGSEEAEGALTARHNQCQRFTHTGRLLLPKEHGGLVPACRIDVQMSRICAQALRGIV